MNRISRKQARNATTQAVLDAPAVQVVTNRYEARQFGDRFVPFDVLTKRVPLGYHQGVESLPDCQRICEKLTAQF